MTPPGTAAAPDAAVTAALDAAVRAHRTEPAWLWAPYIHLSPWRRARSPR